MNKEEFVRKVVQIFDADEKEANLAFSVFLQKITEVLDVNESIKISQLGIFQLKRKNMRGNTEGGDDTSFSDKDESTFYLLYTPSGQDELREKKSLCFKLLNFNKLNSEDEELFFTLSVNKPMIPVSENQKKNLLLHTSIITLQKTFEEKADELISRAIHLENFNIDVANATMIEDEEDLTKLLETSQHSEVIEEDRTAPPVEISDIPSVEQPDIDIVDAQLGKAEEEEPEISMNDFTEREEPFTFEAAEEQTIDQGPEIDIPAEPGSIDEPLGQMSADELKEIEDLLDLYKPEGQENKTFDELPWQIDESVGEEYIPSDLNNSFENNQEVEPASEIQEEDAAEFQEDINAEEDILRQTDEDEFELEESDSVPEPVTEPEDNEINESRRFSPVFIILLATFIFVTAGGVYYFFFLSGKNNNVSGLKNEKSEPQVINRQYDIPLTVVPESDENNNSSDQEQNLKTQSNTEQNNVEGAKSSEQKAAGEEVTSSKDVQPKTAATNLSEKNVAGNIYSSGNSFAVQVSAWRTKSAAEREVNRLKKQGQNAFVSVRTVKNRPIWYRVRIGGFKSLQEAQAAEKKIR